MADPFEALRQPVTVIPPDPSFAAALRARLQAALGRGPDDEPIQEDRAMPDATSVTPAPATTAAITPYLAVRGAREAIAWYVDVLDAEPAADPIVMDDGRIGHAELRIGGALLMLADEFEEMDVLGPVSRGGTTVLLHVDVPDVDATADRAVAAGATLLREPADQFHGNRTATIADPWGHRWMLSTPVEQLAGDEYRQRVEEGGMALEAVDLGWRRPVEGGRPGAGPGQDQQRLEYLTLEVPDVERAREFFGAVLGWEAVPGSVEHGYQVPGVEPGLGLWGGGELVVVPMFGVGDLDAALERVRAAGGTAVEQPEARYGRWAECVDDQGLRFQLLQVPASS